MNAKDKEISGTYRKHDNTKNTMVSNNYYCNVLVRVVWSSCPYFLVNEDRIDIDGN